eukprot:Selendium_serpulae@DN5526_c0_g1_i1.p1
MKTLFQQPRLLPSITSTIRLALCWAAQLSPCHDPVWAKTNRRSGVLSFYKDSAMRAIRSTGLDAFFFSDSSLRVALSIGVLTENKRDLLLHGYDEWIKDGRCSDFVSRETDSTVESGIVPYFFVRHSVAKSEHIGRRLAWHATDALTPIFSDTAAMLAHDEAVVSRAVAVRLVDSRAIYAVTTSPGHHAVADHYGGYCFVNWAAMATKMLIANGKNPFVVDLDYHAGDGTASILVDADERTPSRRFVSLHLESDYPYCSSALDQNTSSWALPVRPGCSGVEYCSRLREALERRSSECDTLVVSVGYDTLLSDLDARQDMRLSLQPSDFGKIGHELRSIGLPTILLQEGGYSMGDIPDAAASLWASLSMKIKWNAVV